MIVLQLKKKWFDMILSGEKREEYREIKQYYAARLKNEGFVSQWIWERSALFQGVMYGRYAYRTQRMGC